MLGAWTLTIAQSEQGQSYNFDQPYAHNDTRIFKGAQIDQLVIYSDHSQSMDIADIRSQEALLTWQNPDEVEPRKNMIYWLKARLSGGDSFKGRHVFQVSQEMGNDLHAYDFIDVYTYDQQEEQTHVRTGRQVKTSDKPIDFWANLIPIDLSLIHI